MILNYHGQLCPICDITWLQRTKYSPLGLIEADASLSPRYELAALLASKLLHRAPVLHQPESVQVTTSEVRRRQATMPAVCFLSPVLRKWLLRRRCSNSSDILNSCIQSKRNCGGYKMRDIVAEIPRPNLPRALAPALMADRVSPIKPTLSPDHFGYTKPHVFSKYFLNDQSPHPGIAKHTVASSFQNILISSTLQTEALGSRELFDYLSQNQGMETEYGNQLLYTSVQRIINATGRLPDEIAEQFFHGISRFIPGISFARVQDGLSRLPVAVPPIGFSMLLLAICLITFHQITPSSLTARPDQASLYTTTKLLFNQATKLTTQKPPAITLIQAGIIIAVYEYARGMPDTAFQSLSGCANMGYDANLPRWMKAHGEGQLWKEGVNTWWAILIYER